MKGQLFPKLMIVNLPDIRRIIDRSKRPDPETSGCQHRHDKAAKRIQRYQATWRFLTSFVGARQSQ